MQDLSSKLPGGPVDALVPTSQEAGNMMASRDGAMSAPGSDPVTPLPGMGDQADPHVDDTSYDPRGRMHVSNDLGGNQIPDSNKGRATLFTQDDGSGWKKPRSS